MSVCIWTYGCMYVYTTLFIYIYIYVYIYVYIDLYIYMFSVVSSSGPADVSQYVCIYA